MRGLLPSLRVDPAMRPGLDRLTLLEVKQLMTDYDFINKSLRSKLNKEDVRLGRNPMLNPNPQ